MKNCTSKGIASKPGQLRFVKSVKILAEFERYSSHLDLLAKEAGSR